jgi:FkbM family methyltransferase
VRYCGYELVYEHGDRLVERIRAQGDYEPELMARLVDELRGSQHRTFVDVGANIGIVSLAVLAGVPDARIDAFEPAPRQHALLSATIRRNGLARSITLHRLALADRAGTSAFAIHAPWLAAGDGLLDTGRSGRVRRVTVETDTLDRWWARAGRPPIDVVKLDTEGSELMILQGAAALLAACRPTLFLEIHEQNLRPYPYGREHVRSHVEGLGYALEPVGPAEFLARPR